METHFDIRQVVSQTSMSTRPAFYTGRGATRADLKGEPHLIPIWKAIVNAPKQGYDVPETARFRPTERARR